MQGASAAGVETEDVIGKEIWQDAHIQYNSLSTTLLPSSPSMSVTAKRWLELYYLPFL